MVEGEKAKVRNPYLLVYFKAIVAGTDKGGVWPGANVGESENG